MIGVLVLGHGNFAQGLLGAAELILGPQERVRALGLDPGLHRDVFRDKAAALTQELDQGEGVLLLVDLAGGTPANVAAELITAGRRALVSGVNLPMLVEVCLRLQGAGLVELASQAAGWGSSGIHILTQKDLSEQL